MIHSTLGKGRTFAPIPSPQPGPQNTLAAPSRVLLSDLSFAEQRSGLSPFLIVSSLSLFTFGTNSSQTGPSSSSPATTPRKRSAPFQGRAAASPQPKNYGSSFTSTEGDTRCCKTTNFLQSHVSKGPSPTTIHG